MLSGYGVGSLFYTRNVKKLVKWFGENGLLIWGGGLMAITFIPMCLNIAWYLLIPVIMLMGTGYYMLHSTLQTKATELSTTNRSTAVSLFAFMLFTGQGIGTAIQGALIDNLKSYEIGFFIGAIALALLGWGTVQLSKLPFFTKD
jgi:predicted MFS family arabinose efflux permease